ncbi:MAG: aconitase family protein, partial [Myxococcota bacterium]
GSTELATILATGQVWLRVPETVRIDLELGRQESRRPEFDPLTSEPGTGLPPRTTIRDLTMRILGDLRTEFALYRAIEYGGSGAAALSLDQRLILGNQAIEMSAKNAIVVPDATLAAELGAAPDAWPGPDDDAGYCARHRYDLSQLVPQVALPPSPDNTAAVTDVGDIRPDMAWLGSCAGGRHSDLRAAAAMVRGQRLRIPFLVTPATQAIYQACAADGTLAILAGAGATVLPPGCGACAGIHAGVQGEGDRIIATATRNFPGRMGSRQSEVYLASPYTVAAAAVTGQLVDPRTVALAAPAGPIGPAAPTGSADPSRVCDAEVHS